jgi:hypothetical protein
VPGATGQAGLVKAGGFAQLSEEAFLRDFAGDIEPAKARILYERLRRPGGLSRVGTPSPRKTGRSRPSWSASWPIG